MIRALKVVLIVWAVLHILLGLALIVAPHQTAAMMGFGEIANFGVYVAGLWGAAFIAASVWLIAAARDPLKHIAWVKFVILLSILSLVVQLYTVIQGAVDFSQAAIGIVGGAVFAAAFLAFYPWRAARGGESSE